MQSDLIQSGANAPMVGSIATDAYQNRVPFLIGRIIVGGFYVMSGILNFVNFGSGVGFAASKGVPMPQIFVAVAALLLLIGGLSILTGIRLRAGVAALVIFFLPVTFIMHNFWTIQDPMMRMIDMHSFQSNLALMGSALMFLAIETPWPSLFGIRSTT